MKYNQLIVYYFSGTGNAKNAAIWIEKEGKKQGLKTQLVNIDRFEKVEAPEITEKTLIGFCAATHGFNLPPIMLKYIARFPKVKNADAFILNTRGGLKLNKLFLPGASGMAQLWPALVLWLKGFKIVGMQPLDLPSNWIILHPGLRQKVIDSIYTRCQGIVRKFANDILSGKRRYKALLSLPIDIALIPITLGYYFIGRFYLAKTLVATYKCNNCNVCINKCPVSAITTVNNRPFWTYRCESCMRCINICPQRAIETAHSFAIPILVSLSVIISPLLLKGAKAAGILDIIHRSYLTEQLWSLVDWFFFLVLTFICYGILHFSMRIRLIDKLVAYTSLSTYNFWRRYKAPKQV